MVNDPKGVFDRLIDIQQHDFIIKHRARQHAPAEPDSDQHFDGLQVVRRHADIERQLSFFEHTFNDAPGKSCHIRQDG